MLRIRDHKQKLVDLHNLTTSRGLIGTQATATTSSCCPRRARGGKGQREAPFLNNRRLFDARGKVPEGTLPVRPPAGTRRPALAAGASSSGPPTADGLRDRDPRARPSSQSFSRGYGSILPTSLAYIVPSTERLFTLETRCGYEYDRA
ncbi:unnamed protein product [Prunus brigantina]